MATEVATASVSNPEKMREHALEQIMKLVKSQLSLEKNQRRLERRVRLRFIFPLEVVEGYLELSKLAMFIRWFKCRRDTSSYFLSMHLITIDYVARMFASLQLPTAVGFISKHGLVEPPV